MVGAADRLSRDTALELWTAGSAWFSSEQEKKGRIKEGQLADVAVLSRDFFSVPEDDIKSLESVLTVVGGNVVYGSGEFSNEGPAAIPVLPEWSPVTTVPGHFRALGSAKMRMLPHQCTGPCGVHAHTHSAALASDVPVSDFSGFWGALGCSCFAF